MIESGGPAPDFTLADQDGQPVTLSALRGRNVVLYFYPKADGRSTRALPYKERRRLLEELGLAGERCWVPSAFADGEALLAACRGQELEGVVAKRLGGRYLPGRRSESWQKRKLRRREKFVVAGYSVHAEGKPDELFLGARERDRRPGPGWEHRLRDLGRRQPRAAARGAAGVHARGSAPAADAPH